MHKCFYHFILSRTCNGSNESYGSHGLAGRSTKLNVLRARVTTIKSLLEFRFDFSLLDDSGQFDCFGNFEELMQKSQVLYDYCMPFG
jgi:hypothetical protein